MSTVSFAEIPLTRDLSLGSAMCAAGLYVKRSSAHAKVYDDLLKEGMVEELDCAVSCFRVFRTTELGELMYESRNEPAAIDLAAASMPIAPGVEIRA